MKKLLSVLLILSMLLSVMMLASCDLGGSDDENETEETEEGGGGNDFTYEQSESEKVLAGLASKNGYEITYTVSSDDQTDEYRCGAKGNVTWFVWGETGLAIVQTSDKQFALYNYRDETWTFDSNMAGDNVSDVATGALTVFNANLYWANVYASGLESSGTTTICGRKCRTYKYDYSFMTTGAYYLINVDEETGLTMEYKLSVSSASAHYLVTSFKIDNVSVPDLPAPGEDYIDVSGVLGWPENSFTALLPDVDFGTVTMSGITDGTFSAILSGVTIDNFNAYLSAVQQKGFTGEDPQGTDDFKIYEGEDASGNQLTLTFSGGSLIIGLEKSEN